MHTRHCPRHVFAAPPAHFSGVNVTRGRVVRGLYAAERMRGMTEGAGWIREHERVSQRERGRERERNKDRERKRETSLEGWRLSCGSISGGGKPTANERNISLKKCPLLLFTSHPPCAIGLVGPRTSTSRIDSLTNGADVPSFPRETGNSSNSRR